MAKDFTSIISPHIVGAIKAKAAAYPSAAPFHPDTRAVEAPFAERSEARNNVYEAVREVFRVSGLDSDHFGTRDWNPLSGLIAPGETVLLKPNLVKESHPRDPDGWQYVLTHGSVIRAVTDFVWKALQGQGRIWVGDAPQTDSSFSAISEVLGLNEVYKYLVSKGVPFEVADLRQEEWQNRDGVITKRRKLAGDRRGYVRYDLSDQSEFHGHPGAGRYYGADYDTSEVNSHHTSGRHEYLVAGSAIACDVLFSLPKLKTHKKAGITVSLKNLVGINGDKNWLPHHTEGDSSKGGDEHPGNGQVHRTERRIVPYFWALSRRLPVAGPIAHRAARALGRRVFGDTEEVVRSGNWWGNDTIWRMCLDLNKLLMYGNRDGTLRTPGPAGRKRHFVLVDGIVAGEGRGPMNPDPVAAGLIVFGTHPASVDAACAVLMGFDPDRIPIVRKAFDCATLPLADWHWRDVQLLSNHSEWACQLDEISDDSVFHFQPHFGWRGQIERSRNLQDVG